MRIILAAPRGFCAGVNMAIESLDLAIERFGVPIYVYHEIVHKQYVVRTFREKGAVFVDTLHEVPAGSTVLFFRSRSLARDSSDRSRTKTIRDRCHLSTRYQGSLGGNQVRQRWLQRSS